MPTSTKRATAVLTLLLFSIASMASGRDIDIRDCPLDTVTFVDPWAGGTFTVSEVGTRHEYLCNGTYTKEARADETCRGPFGDLILVGDLRAYEDSEPIPAAAIWSVVRAAPCCGWRIEAADGLNSEGVKWLGQREVPTLRELPFASVEGSSADTVDFGNEKHATACTLNQ